MNYVSSYESTVAMAQRMAANLENQALLAVSRMEAAVDLMLEQLIQQTLFPTSAESNPSGQSSSKAPGQAGINSSTKPTSPASPQEPIATLIGGALPISEASLAGGTAPPAGAFTPSQISQAYGFNQITFDNGTIKGDGSGQTIAIVDPLNQPNIQSDLATFDSAFGLAAPPSFTVVNETGGTTLPTNGTSGDAFEESLDVEWAHAITPGANIVLVETNSLGWDDMMAGADYARTIPNVSVVSMSWGFSPEPSDETSYDSYFTTPSGHNGVTFVAATGDYGTQTGLEPMYPSTSSNVLAVGGTVLTTDTAGDYQSETGWPESGGGISAYESQPSYQEGVVTQSSTMRTVPDVSLDASDYAVFDSFSGGGWQTGEGTSFGTPIWAALIAIADQGRALNNEGTLDGPSQTLPALYQMPSSNFHDITTGSNGAYKAQPGYDLVTGVGTPIANLVVNSLVSYGSYWQTVNLSSSYNQVGISDGKPFSGGGLDGSGHELGTPGSIGWQGTSIPYGPPNANDVVSANGQTINLPAGTYSLLTIFATAVNGDQTNQRFTVVYSNGGTQTFTLSLSNWTTVPGGYSDEVRANLLSQYNADGTNTGTTVYDSGYALPLNNTESIKSIILPNDSDVKILGMALYHDGATGGAVDLSSSYNQVGISDGKPFSGGGLDGNGHELGTPGTIGWRGTSIPYGPPNANDVVSANGQTINLPAGTYSLLTIFATAVNGDQTNQPFTVVYSNGGTQTFTQSLTNWTSVPGGYSDEIRANLLSQYNADGSNTGTTVYDSGYVLPLNVSLQVKSVILPQNGNVKVLGMLLS